MAVYYHKKPIVRDGLVFQVDANNNLSYVSGDITTTDTINQVTGTLTNGVGYTDNAWDFDGINDYIDFGTPVVDIQNLRRDDPKSIELWVYRLSSQVQGMLFNTTDSANAFSGFWCSIVDNDFYGVQTGTSGANSRGTTDNPLSINTWHHLVITYGSDSGSAGITLYLDGQLHTGSQTTLDTMVGDLTNETLVIGARAWAPGRLPFHGRISNVKVYTRELSASEVRQNYDSQKYRYQ